MTWLFFGITPSFLEGAYQRMLMFQNFFDRALADCSKRNAGFYGIEAGRHLGGTLTAGAAGVKVAVFPL